MNDNQHELERLLKTLEPRDLSEFTRRRIDEALQKSRARMKRVRWVAVALASAAAVVLAVWGGGLLFTDEPSSEPLVKDTVLQEPKLTNDYQLVSVDTVLVDQKDEGSAIREDGERVRRVRYDFVDKVRWYNPRQRRTLTTTAPRREVKMVSYETY